MKKYILFLLLIACGCTSKTKTAINIKLSSANCSLKITGIPNNILQELTRDTATTEAWQNLIPVYRMPVDTDMMDFQPIQPGKYIVTDSSILFTPDTPFVKQQTYFVRFYQYAEGNSTWDYIKGGKKLGKPLHTDLIFKQ